MEQWLTALAQIGTFEAAKDWILVTLLSMIAALIGGAWMDIKGKIKAEGVRLDAKIEADAKGCERLTRLEERCDRLRADLESLRATRRDGGA